MFRSSIPFEGVFTNETVIAQVSCAGKTIIDFITSSPVGMTKTVIANPSTGRSWNSSFSLKVMLPFWVFSLSIFSGLLFLISMGLKVSALEQSIRPMSSQTHGVSRSWLVLLHPICKRHF
jgi:hypothetical protein